MKVSIKLMKLENFKGVENKNYLFNGNMDISGCNGAGKTTIATAFYWVFSDKDYDLHSNPPIRTVGHEEKEPKVLIVLDVDGKEIEVSKRQVRSVKKSKINMNETVSYKNVYEINSIEYGEKAFKEKLLEYGIDLNLFLVLSHPNVFTSQKSDDMRKVLFSMADNIVDDLDVASKCPGVSKITNMLSNYTIDEIGAKCSSVIKTFHSTYGKNGELLEAKISGIESRKVDIDVAELELAKNALQKELEENIAKQNDLETQLSDYNKASESLMDLKFDQGELKRKCHEQTFRNVMEAEKEVSLLNGELRKVTEDIDNMKYAQKNAKENLSMLIDGIETCRNEWKLVNEMKFDESSTICPMCKHEFSEEKKQEMISSFLETKRKQLESIEATGSSLRSQIDAKKAHILNLENEITELEKKSSEILEKLEFSKAKHLASSTPIKAEETDEWKVLEEKIKQEEVFLNNFKSFNDIKSELKNEESEIRLKLTDILFELAKGNVNIEIDEQVQKLKMEWKEQAQNALTSESILNELKILKEKKREMLTDSINKKFELVDFELFKVQNNGEIKECCVPSLKGKQLGQSTNTGLELLMKLDIIKGLQKFYNVYFPVFIDGAECFDSKSKKTVNMDCQIVFLTVSNDTELKFVEV